MSENVGIQKKFISLIRKSIHDVRNFESPMALYEWLLQEWGKPLNQYGQRQAWLAAWAVSIDHGMVKL
jgi:hypothetical protein